MLLRTLGPWFSRAAITRLPFELCQHSTMSPVLRSFARFNPKPKPWASDKQQKIHLPPHSSADSAVGPHPICRRGNTKRSGLTPYQWPIPTYLPHLPLQKIQSTLLYHFLLQLFIVVLAKFACIPCRCGKICRHEDRCWYVHQTATGNPAAYAKRTTSGVSIESLEDQTL